MKYMLLIYGAKSCWTEDNRTENMRNTLAICGELDARGRCIALSPLHLLISTTFVRIYGDNFQNTDGPFAKMTEQLGGYYIIDVDNREEANASKLSPETI